MIGHRRVSWVYHANVQRLSDDRGVKVAKNIQEKLSDLKIKEAERNVKKLFG